MSKKGTVKNELDLEVVDPVESNYEKTFDEIMNEILGEDDDSDDWPSQSEEFEKTMEEVANLDVSEFTDNSVEEIDNTQTYKFGGNAHIKLFNEFCFDTGLGEGYREVTVLQTSSALLIDGTFNTSEVRIEKHPYSSKIGKVVFNDKQKTDSLLIGNAGLCGEFDVTAVSIKDNSYVDITLDITNKTKCAYLLIDTRFDKVCGKIRLSENFYNQMPEQNKQYLLSLSDNKHLEITVDDIPFADYNMSSDKISEFTYDEMLQELNLY